MSFVAPPFIQVKQVPAEMYITPSNNYPVDVELQNPAPRNPINNLTNPNTSSLVGNDLIPFIAQPAPPDVFPTFFPNQNSQALNTEAGDPALGFQFIHNPQGYNIWYSGSTLPDMSFKDKTAYPNFSTGY
tara:strand:+ start:794 stop:1183 length:390 start_codon:yes stop_codon:yes gene_type:complete